MKSHKELIVWQKSFQLSLEVYKSTKQFPKDEIYGIVSQMRRAAVSIPSNIAEGYARGSRKEYIQFLKIAFGSANELETQLLIANKLNYDKNISSILKLNEEVLKMLNVLIIKLSRP